MCARIESVAHFIYSLAGSGLLILITQRIFWLECGVNWQLNITNTLWKYYLSIHARAQTRNRISKPHHTQHHTTDRFHPSGRHHQRHDGAVRHRHQNRQADVGSVGRQRQDPVGIGTNENASLLINLKEMYNLPKLCVHQEQYEACKSTLGLCIPGFQVYSVRSGVCKRFGKEYGKGLDATTIKNGSQALLFRCLCANLFAG